MMIWRYIVLWMARTVGRIRHWVSSGWRPPLFWLAATALGVWLAERGFGLEKGTWFDAWKILSLYVVFVLLWWIWRARQRVIVEEFVDQISDPPKSITKGLSALLVVELARLRELYREVDEQRAIPTAVGTEKAIDATVNVENVSDFLKDAVSKESKFSLGKLELPVGTIMVLISRLVQGPRLIGGLHRDNTRVILTAQLIGGRRAYSWRVESHTPNGYQLNEMINEMACRIFTDLALSGAVRWRAVQAFNEGLRSYRDCLRASKERKLKLMQAEKNFINALSEDAKFDLAYYNLGVVYTELPQTHAADRAFSRAIEQNPERWQAYYALALNHYQRGRYDTAMSLCDRVIVLKPDYAPAYDLKGLAQRLLGDLGGAIKSRNAAAAQSWKALCVAELHNNGSAEMQVNVIPRLRHIACQCLRDLAVAYCYQAQASQHNLKRKRAFHRAEKLLRQALSLTPSNPDLHFELGKIHHEQKKYDLAGRAYQAALQIAPAMANFWAYLALVHISEKNQAPALQAWEKFLNHSFDYSRQQFAPIVAVFQDQLAILKQINIQTGNNAAEAGWLNHWSEQIDRIKKLFDELDKVDNLLDAAPSDATRGEALALDLQKKLQADEQKPEWEYAQLRIAQALCLLNANQPEQAETCFRQAIATLEKNYPHGIRAKGLRALLANSLQRQGKQIEAIREAENARWLEPNRSYERVQLGEVYFNLSEFDRARAVWEEALLWSPDDPAIHVNLGVCYLKLALNVRDREQRKILLEQSAKYLHQALDLYDSAQLQEKGWAHHTLGRLHDELCEYSEAIANFTIAKNFGFAPLMTTFYLGWAYLRNKVYDESVQQFRWLIQEIEKKIPTSEGNAILNESLEPETGDQMAVGQVLAWAHLSVAFSYAERDANLNAAQELVGKANVYIEKLNDGAIKDRTRAAHADCEGWILFKQNKIDDAIARFEQALALTAAADAYLHLALSYEKKLQDSKDEAERRHLIARVQACCRHVDDLDLKQEYFQQANDLRLRLHEKLQTQAGK
ncbi:MAG: tetratricopeptide repeat protein [candidate division KSB1 bacterium]|nr:tetratricopeptide repeat protein [candidate division KSB1 bacterium]MDZ7403892.1 tetratricopeptide repeat protein [candidate division KSB1 bacterium]